jgi:branched-chain amino acid transport system substrate-binding protein
VKEVIMMKGFSLALIVCLLLILFTVPACVPGAEEAKVIKIGVIGPMQFVQGEHHWYGATMARDEINAAGGISLGGVNYPIELIRTDSNEILNPADAAAAMERLITVDKADFAVGGFRTEGVFPMQDVAMDYKTIFLGCGAGTKELCTRVAEDYDRYKYWFRVTPFNNEYLASNSLMALGLAGGMMQMGLGIEETLQVAIVAEEATWADAMVAAYQAYVPQKLGMEVIGVWRPSATATDLTAELTAIEDSGAHLILTIISGPLGIPYAKQLGELEIPVASVGINVEAQKDGFWDATEGYGNYETTLNSYAKGVAITEKTISFVDAFIEKAGETPTYNADTYGAIYILKEAIERAGTLDSDAVVTELEKTDFLGTQGRIVFMGRETATPHDVTYGPGYVTGIATQWQDGEMKCVWPMLMPGDWEGLMYEGTVFWQIPPPVMERFAS